MGVEVPAQIDLCPSRNRSDQRGGSTQFQKGLACKIKCIDNAFALFVEANINSLIVP